MAKIKSPINYIGNKYKLIDDMLPLFPPHISTFVDLFGGSGTVTLNVDAQNYIYNDINPYIVEIFKGMFEYGYERTVSGVQDLIDRFNLTKTNKDGFEKLRQLYNTDSNYRNWVVLYTLMCYSFNYQFRFNSNHEYNSSFGKDRSYFSDTQRAELFLMLEKPRDIKFTSQNFRDVNLNAIDNNSLVYCDPPYLNSIGNYNDGKRGFEGWDETHEKSLLNLLNELDSKGIKFALSNNLKYDNDLLVKWMKSYNVFHVRNGVYQNSSYNKKDREVDDEVLICNYTLNNNSLW